MAKKQRRANPAGTPEEKWDTAGGRVRWLYRHRWRESRSAMAKACKVSLTGIIKVVTNQQQPGRRLLATIAENTDVSPAWLLTGQGLPFTSSALAVAEQVLPGAPQEHADLLINERVGGLEAIYSPTRYWLRVRGSEPVVRDAAQKVRAGDLLLMETDKSTFPVEADLLQRLCVVRVTGKGSLEYKLADVTYYEGSIEDGPSRLEADTFDLGPEVVTETVVQELPGGELRAFRRRVRRQTNTGGRLSPRLRPVTPPEEDFLPLRIQYADIVAVGVLLVRK